MSYWQTETEGGVVVATYHNPPMNYFCADAIGELSQLVDGWEEDASIRAVVITGGIEGKFVTHYSVEELLSMAEDRDGMRAAGTALTDAYHGLQERLRHLPKPVIVAMNGDAMGGGFEFCLGCDIRIAQQGDYRFGLPEIKLGILPGGSGTQRLSRLIGGGNAINFILRGRVVPPDEALALGLVHEVVPDALAHAKALAADLAKLAPRAVWCIKRCVYDGGDTHIAAGLQMEGFNFLETMLSDDGVAAMRAYVEEPYEKRRDWLESPRLPEFKGH
ncbi:3-hydroxybutyryl-CoA dehydratase [Salinisphaera sp. PC39]|uniref:enoyl-CoA hydratase/isomerase family protein n=1 Tax=Salinisphaera sp. PC39 TaxID=1304156 RepID=UPI00334070FD